MGAVLVKKTQAEPAQGSTELRWIASGKTILNNKGKPVKQYEPYFSLSAHKFEEPLEVGVTTVMFYDSAGRLIRTEMPDGTFSRIEFSPWLVKTFDASDTINEPNNGWYLRMSNGTAEEQRAAGLAAVHANTPAQIHIDSLGREVITIAHNRVRDSGGLLIFNGENYRDDYYLTFSKLDAEGKPLWIKDALGSLVMQYVFPYSTDNRGEPQSFVPCYDISGNLLFQHSMDAGDRWTINDAVGKPMFAWDIYKPLETDAPEEKRLYFTTYDSLHRPTGIWLKIDNAIPIQIERYEYTDTTLPNGKANPNLTQNKAANLIGQLKRHYDSSGLIENIAFDFKGSPIEVRRRLLLNKQSSITNWKTNPLAKLDTETFIQITEYDALKRMSRLFNWHKGTGSRVAIYKPTYNQRGVLQQEALIVGAKKTNTVKGYKNGKSTNAIAEIRYNVKGQREFLKLGNGAITRYDYDEKTFRLRQLRTTRPGSAKAFPEYHSGLQDPSVLQQLNYTYDPVGNITGIYDEAFEPVFFQNQKVEAHSKYKYDALYRLTEATGRENGSLVGAPNHVEGKAVNVKFPVGQNDPNALRNYTQFYEYDAVGNIKKMDHNAGGGSWTRNYRYALEDTLIPASNRLLQTWTGSNPDTKSVNYRYDSHGSMLNLANVPDEFRMRWDYRDMISTINLGNGTAHYQYDSGKQRTRKYLDYRNKIEERIYLGGLEIYRQTQNGMVVEEIETLHLFDGEQRLLMVDQIIQTNNASLGVRDLYRYTLSNHLGSSTMELDEQAAIISYEEYHPYGTSAYRAGRNEAEVKLKRYRYTGMERDEESGLSYHTARYYLPWLGRWNSTDPIGLDGGINQYSYCKVSPTTMLDSNGKEPTKLERLKNRAEINEDSTRRLAITNSRNEIPDKKLTLGKGLGSTVPDNTLSQPDGSKVIIEDKLRSLKNERRMGGDPVARGRDVGEMAEQAAKNLKNARVDGVKVSSNNILVTLTQNPPASEVTDLRNELKEALGEWKAANPENLTKEELSKIKINVTTQARKNAALKAAETAAKKRALHAPDLLKKPATKVNSSKGTTLNFLGTQSAYEFVTAPKSVMAIKSAAQNAFAKVSNVKPSTIVSLLLMATQNTSATIDTNGRADYSAFDGPHIDSAMMDETDFLLGLREKPDHMKFEQPPSFVQEAGKKLLQPLQDVMDVVGLILPLMFSPPR